VKAGKIAAGELPGEPNEASYSQQKHRRENSAIEAAYRNAKQKTSVGHQPLGTV